MARIQFTPLDVMSPAEKSAHDEAAAGLRGHAPAPMAAWLRNPELARRAQKLGEFVRFQIDLLPRLRELAVLVVARHWSAHHEWRIHKQKALEQGLSTDIIAAITQKRTPSFTDDVERVVYDVSTSLVHTRALPDALYRSGVRALGEKGLVELVSVLGYYTFVSMTLTAFEIGLPEQLQPELLD
jgi:4-carboxymuconolactone decarboxylase